LASQASLVVQIVRRKAAHAWRHLNRGFRTPDPARVKAKIQAKINGRARPKETCRRLRAGVGAIGTRNQSA